MRKRVFPIFGHYSPPYVSWSPPLDGNPAFKLHQHSGNTRHCSSVGTQAICGTPARIRPHSVLFHTRCVVLCVSVPVERKILFFFLRREVLGSHWPRSQNAYDFTPPQHGGEVVWLFLGRSQRVNRIRIVSGQGPPLDHSWKRAIAAPLANLGQTLKCRGRETCCSPRSISGT